MSRRADSEAAQGPGASGTGPERRQPSSGPAPDAPASEGDSGVALDASTSKEDEGERVEADLDALLEETKRERDEYLELARRARADFENYRKRAARDVSDAERRGKVSVARDLVPVLDNLERALQTTGIDTEGPAAGDGEAPSEEVSAHQALAQGVALVHRELSESLARVGVEAYDPRGERFDPTRHEALSTRPAEDTESGTVVETLQKGYRLDGQVLRAARVVVAE